MRACAIVVSYNTGPTLADCLASIVGVDEIIIVDNGNAAPEIATLDRFVASHLSARLIRGHGNIGFAAACNKAARLAESDVLAFVNPDVVLEAGAIPRLVAAVEQAPPPTIVGGDLRGADGKPERGSRRDRLTLWRAFVAF